MSSSNGMNYAPQGKPRPVVTQGEFIFAAMSLDHGHIYGMCNGLREAGGTLKWVYDPDPAKVEVFCRTYPEVQVAFSQEQILQDNEVILVGCGGSNERARPAWRESHAKTASIILRTKPHSQRWINWLMRRRQRQRQLKSIRSIIVSVSMLKARSSQAS